MARPSVCPFATLPLQPIRSAQQRRRRNTIEFTEEDFLAMSRPVSSGPQSAALQQVGLRKAGWLTKQGAGMFAGAAGQKGSGLAQLFSRKSWKRRYFVLQDTMLKYYKRDTALPQDVLGYINLTSDCLVEDNEGKSFFVHTPYRIYSAIADTPEDAKEWIAILRSAVTKAKKAAAERLAAQLEDTILEEC